MEESKNIAFSFVKLDGVSVREVERPSIDKPTVIMLGGNQTINISESMRNLAIIRSIIGNKFILRNSDKFDIYSICYNKGYVLSKNYYLNPKYTDEDFLGLANKIFLPLVTKKFEKLSVEKSAENLKKVVFFAHSAGALVMDNMIREFRTTLMILGYSRKEINYLLSQITFLTYSPYSVVHFPISAVYITPINDSLNSWMRTLLLKDNREEWSVDFADIEYKRLELIDILKKQDFISYTGRVCESKFLNITPGALRKDNGEDHGFVGILKNDHGKFPYASETGKNIGELMQFFLQTMIEKSIKDKKTVTNNEYLDAFQEFLKIYANEKTKQRLMKQIADKVKKQIFIDMLKEYIKEEVIKILMEDMKNKNKGKNEDEWTN